MPEYFFEQDKLLPIFTGRDQVGVVAARPIVHSRFRFPNYFVVEFWVQHPAVDAVS